MRVGSERSTVRDTPRQGASSSGGYGPTSSGWCSNSAPSTCPDRDNHRDTEHATMTATHTLEDIKRTARRFPDEVANDGHVDRIDEICTPDVREHTPLADREGREELKAHSESVHAAFPDLSVTVEDTVAEGDTVAHRLTFRGTHEGEFRGIPPTGNAVEVANTLFTRVEDGQIAERWLQVDTLGLLAQLGVVDPPLE